MFENIEEKLKAIANIFTVIGFIASIISGIVCWVNHIGFLVGLIILVVGCLFSWAGGCLLYGFGELIESTKAIERATRTNSPISPIPNSNASQKSCPSCFNRVAQSDTVCKHCGEKLS